MKLKKISDPENKKFSVSKTLKKVSDYEYEVPKEGKMNVAGKVFASDKLIKDIDDKVISQVKNVAMLPGIIGNSLAMSDAHMGYGFCIGGVAAFDIDKGIISPGGVGFDINCGVRLLSTNLSVSDIKGREKEILHSLFRTVPTGTGKGSKLNLTNKDLDEILRNGSQWCIEKGNGVKEDYLHTEEEGKIKNADPRNVSKKAKQRGIGQLGSLGSGNHFLEIQKVEKVFDDKVAEVFGLKKDQIVIMIHCGSRGLGHQVATDYIRTMEDEYGWPEQDRQLVNAPIKSELGKNYLSAMAAAANFAFANRQLITHLIREDLQHYFPNIKVDVVYDITHNIAKFEKHKGKEVLIMRKGATRSLGIGRKELPINYQSVGQPIMIPGSMGTSSYVLVGTNNAEDVSLSSTAHGAGRVESRTKARGRLKVGDVIKDLKEKGITLEAGSMRGIVEEAPSVYKDVDEVVRVSHELGIGNLVAKMIPIGVVKG
jgi:tRNA-splicing ligase RtcB (3'-phosphate/5'-hydroxy nucleic acid ligase)